MCSYGHRFALMIAMSLYCESCLQLQNTLCFVRQSLDKTLSEPLQVQVLHDNPSIAFKWLSGKFSARETIFLGVLVRSVKATTVTRTVLPLQYFHFLQLPKCPYFGFL